MARMFSVISETWNPVTGCEHFCAYCWARRMAETRLKKTAKYRNGFKPSFHRQSFRRRFSPGSFVFVVDMGDLWGDWVPEQWIRAVLSHVKKFPRTTFLMLTKNPERYSDFLGEMPPNVVLGATIETNRDYMYREHGISRAPLPSARYSAMKNLDWPRKFVSIEPILDFDLDEFASWIEEIGPSMVYVGYDNYGNKLPEPPLSKTLDLIRALQSHTEVHVKTLRKAWWEKEVKG